MIALLSFFPKRMPNFFQEKHLNNEKDDLENHWLLFFQGLNNSYSVMLF